MMTPMEILQHGKNYAYENNETNQNLSIGFGTLLLQYINESIWSSI